MDFDEPSLYLFHICSIYTMNEMRFQANEKKWIHPELIAQVEFIVCSHNDTLERTLRAYELSVRARKRLFVYK